MRSRTPRSSYPLATVAGAASIIVCVSLAGAAYAWYPWAFSPMTNWISDLGNRLLSPIGSILFRSTWSLWALVLRPSSSVCAP